LRCQWYGHIAKVGPQKGVTTCGCCGKDHDIKQCTSPEKKHCVSCTLDDHSSNNRDCPSFQRKKCKHNLTHAGNLMPFFPLRDDWTGVSWMGYCCD
ncbi:hypothetical protein BDV98DRAFT_640668, partial [Pterulicium gracile]